MLQNNNLTGRVNELVQEQEGTQLYIRDMMLERNAATKDFNSEQELREALTEKLKQCNYLKDQATQDYAAEHFKNAGLQNDLNRMRPTNRRYQRWQPRHSHWRRERREPWQPDWPSWNNSVETVSPATAPRMVTTMTRDFGLM